jgi:hypothetical protein
MRTIHLGLILGCVPLLLVSATAVGGGRGNLAWTAVTADPNSRRCGHATNEGLTDSASIVAHADAQCGG